MARGNRHSADQKRRQALASNDRGSRLRVLDSERPQGIKNTGRRPLRKSARLEELRRGQEETKLKGKATGQTCSSLAVERQARCLTFLHATKPSIVRYVQNFLVPPNRKRLREFNESPDPLSPKPARMSLTCSVEVGSWASDNKLDLIRYWAREARWPREYFQQHYWTRTDFERDIWSKKYCEERSNMSHLLARKKLSPSLCRKRSEDGSVTPNSTTASDEKQREVKSAPYARQSYATILETKGSFVRKSELGITSASKDFIATLLETQQSVLEYSLFRDDLFDETCEMIQDRNEAKVIQDIARLVVPSAQSLAIHGAKGLKILTESVNEGWNSAIPFYGSRPQPDYSVGFGRLAFTEDQLEKLNPFVGDITDKCTSWLMSTWRMYFPFLTCEVKCGAAALDIADRQNAHSMTLAVRAVVELFKLVKRENEVNREILAFSISHNDRTVRIYGHYAIIDGSKTTFYRHPIHEFSFTALDGKEKWTAYKFTKNVYNVWMPIHFKRICSVVDKLPRDFKLRRVAAVPLSRGIRTFTGLREPSSRAVDR